MALPTADPEVLAKIFNKHLKETQMRNLLLKRDPFDWAQRGADVTAMVQVSVNDGKITTETINWKEMYKK